MSKGNVDMEAAKVKKVLDLCLKEPANRLCAECNQKVRRGQAETGMQRQTERSRRRPLDFGLDDERLAYLALSIRSLVLSLSLCV